MTVTELRFPSPSWRFHIRGLSVSILGIGFLALGLAALSFVSWKPSSFFFIAGGIFSTLLGIATIVLVWFTFIYGTAIIWIRWRQLRRPAAIIDADGIRYLAARRPTRIPWSDIEEVRLDRDLRPGTVVTKASVRVLPEAAVLRDGPVKVPGTRYLNIGLMSDLGIPEDCAVGFLEDTAGPRLKVTETDRRTPSAAHGYR